MLGAIRKGGPPQHFGKTLAVGGGALVLKFLLIVLIVELIRHASNALYSSKLIWCVHVLLQIVLGAGISSRHNHPVHCWYPVDVDIDGTPTVTSVSAVWSLLASLNAPSLMQKSTLMLSVRSYVTFADLLLCICVTHSIDGVEGITASLMMRQRY